MSLRGQNIDNCRNLGKGGHVWHGQERDVAVYYALGGGRRLESLGEHLPPAPPGLNSASV